MSIDDWKERKRAERRINPIEIPALFIALGIRPVVDTWAGVAEASVPIPEEFEDEQEESRWDSRADADYIASNPDPCGCLAIALAADARKARGGDPAGVLRAGRKWDRVGIRFGEAAGRIAAATKLHADYVLGLICGWDNRDPALHPTHTEEYRRLFRAGWDDGRAAALACGPIMARHTDNPGAIQVEED